MGKFITLLVLLGFLSLYFWWILGAFIVVGLVCFWRAVWQELQRAKDAEAARRAAILARCDLQHAWVMAGDERGTYGEVGEDEDLVMPLWATVTVSDSETGITTTTYYHGDTRPPC